MSDKMSMVDEQVWYRLRDAIILQATKDYTAALKTLKKHPHNMGAEQTIAEVERFFHSTWFATLTELNPDMILNRLKAEV